MIHRRILRRWHTMTAGISILIVLLAPPLRAQERGAALLGELVERLGTTARVLMIGAHPDDEDSQLIAWLTKTRHVETAYLSLTRGEGGQNLIGNELGPALGIIRTEELLAARRVDGAHQYFTRAIDFGFSKTDSETYTRWAKDSILKDVVTVVRAFRPHVIVAVFSGTPADGHGHHQVSGQLAREAFLLAADSARFPPSETSKLPPWTPLKFYRTARFSPGSRAIVLNVGEYSPLLGRSAMEIAAESRSQHMSQGFGILQRKGVVLDSVRLDTSRVAVTEPPPELSIFSGIDTSLARFQPPAVSPAARASLDSLADAITQARAARDLVDPSRMVAPLARVVGLAVRARAAADCLEFLVPQCSGSPADLAAALNTIRDRASRALLMAAGVSVEATAERELVAVGDSVPVTIAVYNRGRAPITVVRGTVNGEGSEMSFEGGNLSIAPDSVVRWGGKLFIGRETRPWWTVYGGQPGTAMFKFASSKAAPVVSELLTGDDRVTSTSVSVVLRIAGIDVTDVEAPIVHRFADPARGEVHRPVAGIPPITILLEQEREYARANAPIDRLVRVFVHSALGTSQTLQVALTLPRGLRTDSSVRTITLPAFGSTSLFFRARGTLGPGRYKLFAIARQMPATTTTASPPQRPGNQGFRTDRVFSRGFVPVEYRHIRPQRFYRTAAIDVEAVDVKFAETMNVAYVKGVGDNVEPMLAQLGIHTTVIDPAMLPLLDFSKFNALVIGPRAYAADDALAVNAPFVLDFARKGGTVVVQYGQNEMTQPGIMPYPIALARPAQRVTDETAAVRVLDPQSPLLGTPNSIGSRDFENWVQERALYMPSTFDSHYHALLSMNDVDEPPNNAAILVTPLGKGTYIYATLSFFRQLPAINPGAARLFVNLLSADRRGMVP